jgi:hypothetical protein
MREVGRVGKSGVNVFWEVSGNKGLGGDWPKFDPHLANFALPLTLTLSP